MRQQKILGRKVLWHGTGGELRRTDHGGREIEADNMAIWRWRTALMRSGIGVWLATFGT